MSLPFRHLLLLVGTNPLPSYVVACYFLQTHTEPLTIWLIHSQQNSDQRSTTQQAQAIQRCLEARFSAQVNLHPVRDISNARSIQEDLRALTARLFHQKIHFNYSGGTKAMALHSYRTLEQCAQIQASFSYLDGRRFMILDDQSGQPLHPSDLRSLVHISMYELIDLHHFSLYFPYSSEIEPFFLQGLRYFQKMLEDDSLESFWGVKDIPGGWGELRPAYMKITSGVHDIHRAKYLKHFRKQLRKNIALLRECRTGFEPNPAFQAMLAQWPQSVQLMQPQHWPELDDAALTQLYQIIRFIDGQWLEVHCFEILQTVLTQLGLKADSCMGLVLKQENWKTYFEIDIAALIGYQLLGISCTTYHLKSACKNKGFEIIHRIRQIGGDEIRDVLKMMLVTFVNPLDKARLQQELTLATGGARQNILVLGREDLSTPALAQAMSQFINHARR